MDKNASSPVSKLQCPKQLTKRRKLQYVNFLRTYLPNKSSPADCPVFQK